MNTASEIIGQALQLPELDRSYLAKKLILSLEIEELSPEWKTEIQERMERFDRGETKGISQEKVFQEIRETLAS